MISSPHNGFRHPFKYGTFEVNGGNKPERVLPLEVKAAHVLRAGGVVVDRLRLKISVPFDSSELTPSERRAIIVLRHCGFVFDYSNLKRDGGVRGGVQVQD